MTILVACGLKREARIIRGVGIIPVVGGGDSGRLENKLEDDINCLGPISAIMSSGIAGALNPDLRPGDVIFDVPAHLKLDFDVTLPWALPGKVIGRDTITATATDKTALRGETGASAVDMETHVARRVAERHGLPFIAVRAIADLADETLPPATLVGMNSDGSMALGPVLRSLARDPQQLPALIRTGRRAGKAFKGLGHAFAELKDCAPSLDFAKLRAGYAAR